MRPVAGGGVMLGSDTDNDVRLRSAERITVSGGPGNDFISARGLGSNGPADVPVVLFGDANEDLLVDGPLPSDTLFGGLDNDTLFSADGQQGDQNHGDAGFDKATIDFKDGVDTTEQVTQASVGRLKLAPALVKAKAGKVAHVKLSWTHPKSWKQLRKIALRLGDGGDVVSRVVMRPKTGHVKGELVARGSSLDHHGKTVTARLALRLPQSLGGQRLRLDVEATDRKGHSQLEPDVGSIMVADSRISR